MLQYVVSVQLWHLNAMNIPTMVDPGNFLLWYLFSKLNMNQCVSKKFLPLNRQKMCKHFHLQASCGGPINIYEKKNMKKKEQLCFEFELFRAQPSWFALYWWRAEKIGSWCNRHLCHTCWLFLCVRQTARHKVAVPASLLSWCSNINFQQTRS